MADSRVYKPVFITTLMTLFSMYIQGWGLHTSMHLSEFKILTVFTLKIYLLVARLAFIV